MTKREIAKRIYLAGLWGRYSVITSYFAGMDRAIDVADYRAGNAIVRALRDVAARHPELMPDDARYDAKLEISDAPPSHIGKLVARYR